MKYEKIMEEIKRQKLKIVDVARVLEISPKELRDKLKGKKPLYIHEMEKLFMCLGIKCGEEKIKFF